MVERGGVLEVLARLERLVEPGVGLMDRVSELLPYPGEPRFAVRTAHLGAVGEALERPGVFDLQRRAGPLDGAGAGLESDEARLRAIAEGLERYASCVYTEKQLLWATADELGPEALDLDTLPRCSPQEYGHPRCPLVPPAKDAPLRWVRGVSLGDGRLVWIPAVLVFLHMPFLSIGERIALPISTGCAAHSSLEEALTSAICEVVERDAIALTWLQELRLPRIDVDLTDSALAPYRERLEQSGAELEYLFFDATTDLGIPTVYCLQLAPRNPRLAVVVACSTAPDPRASIGKIIRELAASRLGLQAPRTIPQELDDFMSVFDGALYMGTSERLEAYSFLLKPVVRRFLQDLPSLDGGTPLRTLARLVARLRDCGLDAFAVDLSTDEALRVGMRVVRVVIPGLQPLSFSYRARFLGHPRLYAAPGRMGHRVRAEHEVNPWPQPFA